MLVTRWSQLSPRAKAAIVAVAGSVTAAQVDTAKNWIIPKLANHPHASTIMGGVFIIAGILMRPEVREALGIKHVEKKTLDPDTGEVKHVKTTTEVVALPEGSAGDGQITTTTAP